MDFDLPEVGSPEFVDLLCRLDRARYENAKAWTVVVSDKDSGEICQVIGPFDEAEQAFVHAGEEDRDWRENEDPNGESGFVYSIVPIFGANE